MFYAMLIICMVICFAFFVWGVISCLTCDQEKPKATGELRTDEPPKDESRFFAWVGGTQPVTLRWDPYTKVYDTIKNYNISYDAKDITCWAQITEIEELKNWLNSQKGD